MATEIRRRRGTTTQHSTFTGGQGELTVDTTKNTVVVHDGVTPGGFPLAKAIGSIVAAQVPSTPAGDLAATDVQAALNELDSEKQPLNATLTSVSSSALIPAIVSGSMGSFSHRNKIINGNFGINQREVTGTVVLAIGAYGHDRFKAGAGGCTYTFATVANVTTLTITAGTLQQVIEGANLSSGTHVLTWTGTATARVDAGSYGASGITGTAVGGTDQTIEFAIGTVSRVQYEQGSVATPFELRPIGAELALCQRYYETNMTGVWHSSIWTSFYFKVVKRAVPTLSTNASGGSYSAGPTVSVAGFYGLYTTTTGFSWMASAEL